MNTRALVVYESMCGNTHVVASDISDDLRATREVARWVAGALGVIASDSCSFALGRR